MYFSSLVDVSPLNYSVPISNPFQNLEFDNNIATHSGGAMFFDVINSNTPILGPNITTTRNVASRFGGAIALSYYNTNVSID